MFRPLTIIFYDDMITKNIKKQTSGTAKKIVVNLILIISIK